MFHSKKPDLRSASRIFSFEMALDYRARAAGAFCPRCGVSALWGRGSGVVGCPPSALSPKVGEVPRRCPLRPVDPPVSLRAPHVLVKSHLVKAGVLGLANSHSDLPFPF